MNIRSLSRGGAPAACLLSRSSGSSVDQIASVMSRRNAMISPRKVSLMENDYQHFMNSSTRPRAKLGMRCRLRSCGTLDARKPDATIPDRAVRSVRKSAGQTMAMRARQNRRKNPLVISSLESSCGNVRAPHQS